MTEEKRSFGIVSRCAFFSGVSAGMARNPAVSSRCPTTSPSCRWCIAEESAQPPAAARSSVMQARAIAVMVGARNLAARSRLVKGESLPDVDRHLRDHVVPVAEPVPLRALGLRAAGQVRRAGPDHGRARLLEAREQLPPLPAVPLSLTHQTRLLPGAATDAHLDASDRGRAGPGHPANRDVATIDLVVGAWLRDQGPHALQGH